MSATSHRRHERPLGMRARLAVLASGVLLMAATTGAQATEATYQCNDGTRLKAVFSPPANTLGNVTLTLADSERSIVLPQTPSADGGRYEKGGMIFWIKGNGATLTRDGKSTECTAS